MITIRGAIFGRLIINSLCISFRNEERKSGPKYKWGATKYNNYDRKLTKKWKLATVRELIVKRYNLIRQAVEIYFDNSKSVLINFFTPKYMRQFVEKLQDCARKAHIDVTVVESSERHFREKRYTEKWVQCKYSNFEYLMLLNKYAGRSFNDLGQYPVFPWIIGNYDMPKLDLGAQGTYRELKFPMAAITPEKQHAAREKYSILAKETEITPFQFGSHYLAARMVLGYLLRLEPYASLLIKFEEGQDASSRMFHIIQSTWKMIQNNVSDNKELIPEFFYLPDMFMNYNKCSFGTKRAGDELLPEIRAYSVRVDQTVMPPWARDSHHFVQMNYLALEGRHVSAELDQWIDLVFGKKQQDHEACNLFKELCDEDAVRRRQDELNEYHVAEIQEFGSNPIRMFSERHPSRDRAAFSQRTHFTIFPNENTLSGYTYVMYQACKCRSAVTFLGAPASDRRLIVVLNEEKLIRSKEDYFNLPQEKLVTSTKGDPLTLFPYQRLLEKDKTVLACDAQRSFALIEGRQSVVTCRHYDNSCKILNYATDTVTHHLFFHRAPVNAVCTTRDGRYLFSGSLDGLVALWSLGGGHPDSSMQPNVVWYACDHEMGVVSVDASKELDLVASASLDGTVALRSINTGKFVRIVRVALSFDGVDFLINKVRLSPRGYILIMARARSSKSERCDQILVYSINGERIKTKKSVGAINSLVLDESGYQFIAGGSGAMLYRYDLLSLESYNLFETLNQGSEATNRTLQQLLTVTPTITALAMSGAENFQNLFIGLNTGDVLIYKMNMVAGLAGEAAPGCRRMVTL